MDDRDIEQMLNRYRPAVPSTELAERIGRLAASAEAHLDAWVPQVRRAPRTWPWAVAAAALLAITVGLHAIARTAPADPLDGDLAFREAVSALSTEFGGGPAARMLAESMLRREAAERDRQQEGERR